MDMDHLFTSVRNARMPGDVRLRLLEGCQDSRRKRVLLFQKTAFVAIVAVLLAGIAAWASVSTGYFRDVKNNFGAVIGTEYLSADREISIEAFAAGNELHIRASFLIPSEFPYREAADLSVAGWKITDSSGSVLFEGTQSAVYPLNEGVANIIIGLTDNCPGECTLTVKDFVSHKKADQPLRIEGTWHCPISAGASG